MRIARERARVQVSATSANLGPGFDTLGLALEMRDTYALEVTTSATEIEVTGEGEGQVPLDDSHLVVRALRHALEAVGAPQIGVRLTCHNVIPHGGGLGSSAAAIVGGIALARAIIDDSRALDEDAMLALATEAEGHPDNAAPAIFGGVTLGYMEAGVARAARLTVGRYHDSRPFLDPVILSPSAHLATEHARSILPDTVPLSNAVVNLSRAALFVHAIASDPEALFAATQDTLHQDARAGAMPASVALMRMLRSEGIPAVISGAGPSVLIPAGAPANIASLVREMVDEPDMWRIARIPLAEDGVRTVLG